MRVVMLGTGDFALPLFERLTQSIHEVRALFTQPDRPQGRQQVVRPSRIHESALARGVPVHQPEDVNAPAGLEAIQALGPDLLVTAAYGQILSAELLSIPRLGGVNLHGSVLPAYRGAAPVARAIQNGEVETGVTVIQMTPRIDAGGIRAIARLAIDPDETAGELEARLAALGVPLVLEVLEAIGSGAARVIPQDGAQVTRAPKLRKEDGQIDWNASAQRVHNLVRAMQPWPMAQTWWLPSSKPPVRLIVHRTAFREIAHGADPGTVIEAGPALIVAAGAGGVELKLLQVPGKRAMPAGEFLRGNRVLVGDRVGGPESRERR